MGKYKYTSGFYFTEEQLKTIALNIIPVYSFIDDKEEEKNTKLLEKIIVKYLKTYSYRKHKDMVKIKKQIAKILLDEVNRG